MRVFFSSQCIINAIIITLLNINTFISIIMIKNNFKPYLYLRTALLEHGVFDVTVYFIILL